MLLLAIYSILACGYADHILGQLYAARCRNEIAQEGVQVTSLLLGWTLLLEALIESRRFAKPVMQDAWIWIALYFATYLVFDYFLHTNEEAYVLVLLGTLIMLVVLVAHMAVRCHRLILASKI